MPFGRDIRRVVYRSKAMRPFTPDELEQLAAGAAERNRLRGLTGGLVYDDGVFVQILEGDGAAIEDLLARIRRDPRHGEIEILQSVDVSKRRFGGDWMAYSPAGAHIGLKNRSLSELLTAVYGIFQTEKPIV